MDEKHLPHWAREKWYANVDSKTWEKFRYSNISTNVSKSMKYIRDEFFLPLCQLCVNECRINMFRLVLSKILRIWFSHAVFSNFSVVDSQHHISKTFTWMLFTRSQLVCIEMYMCWYIYVILYAFITSFYSIYGMEYEKDLGSWKHDFSFRFSIYTNRPIYFAIRRWFQWNRNFRHICIKVMDDLGMLSDGLIHHQIICLHYNFIIRWWSTFDALAVDRNQNIIQKCVFVLISAHIGPTMLTIRFYHYRHLPNEELCIAFTILTSLILYCSSGYDSWTEA